MTIVPGYGMLMGMTNKERMLHFLNTTSFKRSQLKDIRAFKDRVENEDFTVKEFLDELGKHRHKPLSFEEGWVSFEEGLASKWGYKVVSQLLALELDKSLSEAERIDYIVRLDVELSSGSPIFKDETFFKVYTRKNMSSYFIDSLSKSKIEMLSQFEDFWIQPDDRYDNEDSDYAKRLRSDYKGIWESGKISMMERYDIGGIAKAMFLLVDSSLSVNQVEELNYPDAISDKVCNTFIQMPDLSTRLPIEVRPVLCEALSIPKLASEMFIEGSTLSLEILMKVSA